MWIKSDRAGTYLIVSYKKVAEKLGVAPLTVHRWVKNHGLPVCKLPNGQAAITTGLIDAWLFTRYIIQQKRIKGDLK